VGVVPEGVLVVAGVVVVFVGVDGVVVVFVGVDGVVFVGVDGVVAVDVVGVVFVLGPVLRVWHCARASCPMVETPWVRLLRSVELTEGGRFTTAFASPLVAFETSPQFPWAIAEETASSWLLRVEPWSAESSPEPPPQATTIEAAKPSTPARTARGA
jgi:hypothetical protein